MKLGRITEDIFKQELKKRDITEDYFFEYALKLKSPQKRPGYYQDFYRNGYLNDKAEFAFKCFLELYDLQEEVKEAQQKVENSFFNMKTAKLFMTIA